MTTPSQALTIAAPRLPMPPEIQDLNLWKILTSVIFPNAGDAGVILLALHYCERRGLDVLKRPVNIVPVWNSKLRRNVETIWPSITETEITASRSRQWAGLDAPVFGPLETKMFSGRRREEGEWIDTQITVTFPEYCDRTVWRMIAGERRAFTERVHWLENYGHQGGGDLPTQMWAKRPRDQIAKVAKAAALRAAFPEESEGPTDAEADGMIIPGEDITPAPSRPLAPIPPEDGDGGDDALADVPEKPHTLPVNTDADWRPFGERLIAEIRKCPDASSITAWLDANKANLETMAGRAAKLHATLMRSINAKMLDAATAPPEGSSDLPPGVDPETGEISAQPTSSWR